MKMEKFNPKNVAIISILFIIIGTVFVSLSLEILGIFLIVGYFGLLFSYYYYAVNIWDAGNIILSLIFFGIPIFISGFITRPYYSNTGGIVGMVLGTLIISAIFLLIGLKVKHLIKLRILGIPIENGPSIKPNKYIAVIILIVCSTFVLASIGVFIFGINDEIGQIRPSQNYKIYEPYEPIPALNINYPTVYSTYYADGYTVKYPENARIEPITDGYITIYENLDWITIYFEKWYDLEYFYPPSEIELEESLNFLFESISNNMEGSQSPIKNEIKSTLLNGHTVKYMTIAYSGITQTSVLGLFYDESSNRIYYVAVDSVEETDHAFEKFSDYINNNLIV